jgi:hypothetical protein
VTVVQLVDAAYVNRVFIAKKFMLDQLFEPTLVIRFRSVNTHQASSSDDEDDDQSGGARRVGISQMGGLRSHSGDACVMCDV